MIYYDSKIGHVCPRIMKYLIRYFPSKYGGHGQDSQGRKMLQVILTESQSTIIPKLLSFPANLIKLPFTGWKLFRWKKKIHGTELQKKAIKKEASNPTDFCRNTNLWNFFWILYATCIPHKMPARDGRSMSRALQSSISYSAHTQEAIGSLSGKTIFRMLYICLKIYLEWKESLNTTITGFAYWDCHFVLSRCHAVRQTCWLSSKC